MASRVRGSTQRHGKRRLSEAVVRNIREINRLSKAGVIQPVTHLAFGLHYRVSTHTIHCILHGKTYRDVSPPDAPISIPRWVQSLPR
jgi:hypothetical protein